ncbi:MAG: carbon-nitrogen hydrolase [Gammaproteobacteria bacterium]|nr:carbon-nitrogen hydrolase [Gammaproteobacteria bacterium]MCI0590014.1 carbon-nitrogen hydrolase [Gammaproteobacteria bacterium]
MNTHMSVGLVQHACTEDRKHNLQASVSGICEAHRQGAELVLLPELHCHPYFCRFEDATMFELSESIPGPTTEQLSRVAAELGVVIVASIFERRARGLYHNTAVVLERNGEITGTYRKMHIPDDPGYYEKFYFAPGDQGFRPIPTSAGTLGVLVCWDQWFPEAARLMALAGADLLLYPSAIGWDRNDTEQERARQCDAWITIQRAHAIANSLPLAVCNRWGLEQSARENDAGIEFWGSSFIAGPQGEVLFQAPCAEDAVHSVTLDLARSAALRHQWPYLRDRRVDAYQGLLSRYLD